jgi:hypothetical protein|tara:strand:- start:143 stop:1171 length:1029 start_codon:yes stop_codon:yes gene_type:complete
MAFSDTFDPNAPSGVTGTGSAISNREDLLDVLTILAPEETPVLSSSNKQKASSTFVEWTVDSLAAPSTTGISEGVDVTSFTDKFSGRARLGNYIQKFRRDYMVSDLQEAVDSVGPAKVAQAEAKAIRELKRDVEATLISNNDRSVENGAGSAYGLRGLGDWLDSSGPSDVPSAFRTPSSSIKSDNNTLTETEFNNLITSIYRVTGSTNSLTLVADTNLRRVISDFARLAPTASGEDYNAAGSVRDVNYDGGSSTIKLSVEMYQSDHGMVSIVNMNPDTAPSGQGQDTGYIINPEYFGIAELIPMGSTRLPNLGGGERGYVDCALTSLMYHPGAHGKITDITA